MKTFCVKYRKYTDKYTENIHDMAYGKSKDLAKKLNQIFFSDITHLKLRVIENTMLTKED